MPLSNEQIAELEKHISAGVKNAYFQQKMMLNTDDRVLPSITEYLLTVFVATQLVQWRIDNSLNVEIRLEYAANDFLKSAFEAISFFQNWKRRLAKFSIRKGRIDICVLTPGSLHSRSVVGIELKPIGPPAKLVKADLRRFIDAMTRTDSVGENSIQACFCSLIYRLKTESELLTRALFETRLGNLKNVLMAEYETEVQNSGLSLSISTDVIESFTSEDYAASTPQENQEFGDAVASTGAVVAVVFTLKRI